MTDQGVVNARLEPVVRLRVRAPAGIEIELEAIIDTGYTGSLALPATVAAALGLPPLQGGRAVLADGSIHRYGMFAAEVFWNGMWMNVAAWALGNQPLVGMSLLAGRGLWVEVLAGGTVKVRSLSATGQPANP